ncbi:MAG: LytTR family DNA-binding domain-containing protein [Nonlabens ulvanivorans]|uniref:LytR family transcriptional regulator n=3 Tax=Nonlabens ulvanivorans TaxID=906888 RepID=A0A084JTM2_NONUL|nr:LytTR family DNA-binding domain-containing protein [Nonlabens ulvanivorans]KEZ92306.1 LytR family transcriptional regulator [Nonlabens ulvanivorans]PRX15139.1 LytTR family two component transcriptional regulator [Nonlabens ulvanivorans]GAK98819.1 two-component system response regulator [Nonlabens ulvanivorans]GAL74111.1 two-component system response regulator [Nonlabens ulvanivorans]
MKCIIIDDEATARLIISKYCSDVKGLNVLEEFSNAIDAMKYLNQNTVDLIFLDIHMPGFNGIDFIQTIKDPPNVILTTSDPNFAIEAFEYECIVDYLIKPLTEDRFIKAINKASNSISATQKETNSSKKESTEDVLYVNIDRRLIKIDMPSIYLVEAKGDYIMIKTETKNYIVHSTLKKIEGKLPDHTFLKVHRSYVINVSKIIDIEDNCVLIKKDIIPVSRSNRPILMKRLNLL